MGARAIQIKAPPPAQSVVATATPSNFCGTSVAVTLTGSATNNAGFFDPGADVGGPGYDRLTVTCSGGITVTNVTFVSATTVTCTLNTSNKSSGTYTLTITNPDGQYVTSTFTLSAQCMLPGYWVGTTSSNFNTTTNWDDLSVPTSAIAVTVPSSAPNMPKLQASTTLGNITLQAGATLSLNGQTLNLNGAVSGTGTISGSNTSSLVIGGTVGTLNFTSGARILKDLTLNASSTATLGTALDITAGSSFGTVTVNTGATLTTGGNLTLKSDANGTARVAASTGTISGNVVVERYIPANSSRAWRMLSIPTTTSQTIKSSWQENQAAGVVGTSGYGVILSSSLAGWSAAGFDFNSAGDGLLTWNMAGNAWSSVTSTTTGSIATDRGYMVYVRGDRASTPANSTINATVLRTTGSLKQGTYPASAIPVSAGKFELIGNPYASQIDFRNITRTGWDPLESTCRHASLSIL